MRRAIVLNGGSNCYAGECGGSECAVYSCGIYQGWYKPKYEVFTEKDYKRQIVSLANTILNGNPEEYLSKYRKFLFGRDTDYTEVKWSISACRDIDLLREFVDFCESHPGVFDDYVNIAKERLDCLQGSPEKAEDTEVSESQQELFEKAKRYNDISEAEDALLRITDKELIEALAKGEWDYPSEYFKKRIIQLAKTVLNYTPEQYAERYIHLKCYSGGQTDPEFSLEPEALEWAVNNASSEFLDTLAYSTRYRDFRELASERRRGYEEESKRNEANFKRLQRNLFHKAKNYENIGEALDAVKCIKDRKLLEILAGGEW